MNREKELLLLEGVACFCKEADFFAFISYFRKIGKDERIEQSNVLVTLNETFTIKLDCQVA